MADPSTTNTAEADDLHFRTVTTLLNTLNVFDRSSHAEETSRRVRKDFKRLLVMTMLLARGHDVIACIPRRTLHGLEFFVAEEKPPGKPMPRDVQRHDLFVSETPIPVVAGGDASLEYMFLQGSPQRDMGFVDYLISLWSRGAAEPFENHVQVVANLLSDCLDTFAPRKSEVSKTQDSESEVPKAVVARESLLEYTTFQSIRKSMHRLNSKKMARNHLNCLQNLKMADFENKSIPNKVLSFINEEELEMIQWILQCKDVDQGNYPALINFLQTKKGVTSDFVIEYFRLVLTLLENLSTHGSRLQRAYNSFASPPKPGRKLKVPKSEDLHSQIREVSMRMMLLSYFAWTSKLFEWLITDHIRDLLTPTQITVVEEDGEAVKDEANEAKGVKGEGEGDKGEAVKGEGKGVKGEGDGGRGDGGQDGQDEDDDTLDDDQDDDQDEENYNEIMEAGEPSSLLDACLDPAPDCPKSGDFRVATEYISWLRVVTAPAHYYTVLVPVGKSKLSKVPTVSFTVLRNPPASGEMRPWKDVIYALIDEPMEAERTITKLLEFHRTEDNIFDKLDYAFRGAAHCEAVLSTIHYTAQKKTGKNAQTPFPADVINKFKNIPALVAPSKKCCPVCAKIQRALSVESGKSNNYPVYDNHPNISACALPPGLPDSVRQKVVKHFDNILTKQLREIKERSDTQESVETSPRSPVEPQFDESSWIFESTFGRMMDRRYSAEVEGVGWPRRSRTGTQ